MLNHISRQNFANALAENHNLKLEVCHQKTEILCLGEILCEILYLGETQRVGDCSVYASPLAFLHIQVLSTERPIFSYLLTG